MLKTVYKERLRGARSLMNTPSITSPLQAAGPLEAAQPAEFTLGDLQRSPDRFAEAYERYYDHVAGYVYRRVRCRHTCEDIVSDVFMSAYRGMARGRRTKAPVRLWLLRIATNRVHRWIKQTRASRFSQENAVREAETTVERDHEDVHEALSALPAKWQAVLALYYLEGLSVPQVAQVLGCRSGTVKSRLSRARSAMLAEIDRRRSE